MDTSRSRAPFRCDPEALPRYLFAIIGILVLACTAGQISKHVFDHRQLFGFVRMFYLDNENSVPAFFSSLQLLAAALILGAIARTKHRERDAHAWHWTALAFGFAFLAVDENCSIHEMLAQRPLKFLPKTGFFYFAWVTPALLGLATVAFAFLSFLRRLPAETARHFVLSGLLFAGGAVGVEMLTAPHAEVDGHNTLIYVLHVTIEETMEMTGIAFFIRALLRYTANTYGDFLIYLGQPRNTATRAPKKEIPVLARSKRPVAV